MLGGGSPEREEKWSWSGDRPAEEAGQAAEVVIGWSETPPWRGEAWPRPEASEGTSDADVRANA